MTPRIGLLTVATGALGALACMLPASSSAAVRSGNYGGGQILQVSGVEGAPVSILITARPRPGHRRVRIRATIRGICGATTFQRTVAMRDGVWEWKGRNVERTSKKSSVVGVVNISGKLDGDAGVGTAIASLRVRRGDRIRRCAAPKTAFELHYVPMGGTVPPIGPPEGGSLYTGLTNQSQKSRAYGVAIKTSDDGRALKYLNYEYSCRTGGKATASSGYIDHGAIAADGRFTWTQRFSLKNGGVSISGEIRAVGAFRDDVVKGTIRATSRLVVDGKTLARCTQRKAVTFVARL